jgi:hypothetical protein
LWLLAGGALGAGGMYLFSKKQPEEDEAVDDDVVEPATV